MLFPTGKVYFKKQTRVTTNQHIFKSGLSMMNAFLILTKNGEITSIQLLWKYAMFLRFSILLRIFRV